MAISELMLAQAMKEYLQQHADEFAAFLFERYDMGEGYVSWSLKPSERFLLLLLTVTRLSQGGGIIAEDQYEIGVQITKLES